MPCFGVLTDPYALSFLRVKKKKCSSLKHILFLSLKLASPEYLFYNPFYLLPLKIIYCLKYIKIYHIVCFFLLTFSLIFSTQASLCSLSEARKRLKISLNILTAKFSGPHKSTLVRKTVFAIIILVFRPIILDLKSMIWTLIMLCTIFKS